MKATTLACATLLSLATLLPLSSHAAAGATGMCQPGEKVIFSCTTRAKKIASLCSSPDFSATAGTLQYRFGTPGKTELQYPDTPQAAAGKFFFSTTMYSGGGEAHIRFNNAGYDYIMFDRTVRTNFSGGRNNPKFSSGIVVRDRKGGKPNLRSCVDDASIRSNAYEALPTEEFEDLD